MASGATLTFLGSGDAFGTDGRLQTCFHVRTDDGSFLIDCGATVCIGMKRCGIGHDDIDAVVISHFHADHFAGLPFLLMDGRVNGRTRGLRVAGPPDIERQVEDAMEVLFPGAGRDWPYAVEYSEHSVGRAADLGPLRITSWPVVHAPATKPHAVRIEAGGRIIAYSGDTEWDDVLIEVARGADLFICELSGFDGPVGIHLDYPTLLEHRSSLECGQLVITHMGRAVLDNGDTVASGLDAILARDGLSIDF